MQVEVLHSLHGFLDLIEVVSHDSGSFHSVHQQQELGLDSAVEVEFQVWVLVAVDLVVGPSRVWCQVMVVVLDFGDHRVPLGMEVQ